MYTYEFDVFDVFKLKDKRYLVLLRDPEKQLVGVIEYKQNYEETYAGVPYIHCMSLKKINEELTDFHGNDILLTQERASQAAPYLSNIYMAVNEYMSLKKSSQVVYTYGDTIENIMSLPKLSMEETNNPRIEGCTLTLPEYMAYIMTALGNHPNNFIPYTLTIIPMLPQLDRDKVAFSPLIPTYKSKTYNFDLKPDEEGTKIQTGTFLLNKSKLFSSHKIKEQRSNH